MLNFVSRRGFQRSPGRDLTGLRGLDRRKTSQCDALGQPNVNLSLSDLTDSAALGRKYPAAWPPASCSSGFVRVLPEYAGARARRAKVGVRLPVGRLPPVGRAGANQRLQWCRRRITRKHARGCFPILVRCRGTHKHAVPPRPVHSAAAALGLGPSAPRNTAPGVRCPQPARAGAVL